MIPANANSYVPTEYRYLLITPGPGGGHQADKINDQPSSTYAPMLPSSAHPITYSVHCMSTNRYGAGKSLHEHEVNSLSNLGRTERLYEPGSEGTTTDSIAIHARVS